MKAGYFAIETTGCHHDRDSIVSFEGIMFDHTKNQVIERFRYDVVGEKHIVNEMTFPLHEAALMVKNWLSSDCYYFSLNADKAKHFLRNLFYYQYLNPFEHERCGRQNKILDAMSVLRAAHHIGELYVELPVSPLGEVSYEVEAISKLNFPDLCKLEAIVRIIHQVIAEGGGGFRWIKSQDEKKSLFLKGKPIIYLKGIDKELDSIPKVLYPIGQSTTNKNRFYFYEANENIRTPMDAIEGYLESKDCKVMGDSYAGRCVELMYLDTNKSDLVMSLDEASIRYQLDHLRVYRPPKKKGSISDISKLYQMVEKVDRLSHRESDGMSFYESKISYGYVNRWDTIKNFLLRGELEKALLVIGDECNSPIEQRRLRSFLSQEGVKIKNETKGLVATL